MKIIDANTQNFAAQAVIDCLGVQNVSGSRHIVLVPDRFSMSVEREIYERLHLAGAFNIEVVSFTRLAVKSLKGRAKAALTKEGAVVLLSEASRQVKDWEYFSDLDKKSGLLRDLYAVIASIRTSGISAEQLLSAFCNGDDTLSRKYRDIAKLYEAYETEVKSRYCDTVTRQQMFLTELSAMTDMKDTDVYAVGFTGFAAVELSILAGLDRYAKSLTVAVSHGTDGAAHGLCDRRTLSKLKGVASSVEVVKVDNPLPLSVKALTSQLFGYDYVKTDDPEGRIAVFFENTPYDEIKTIGKEVLRLVRGGYRFKDIAVVTHDDSYPAIITDMFSRLGVPHFIDTKYRLKNTAAARLVLSAIATINGNYAREDLLEFAKNPILGIPYSQIESLNNYILKYNINYSYFSKPFTLGADAELEVAESTRAAVVAMLPQLPQSQDVAVFSSAVKGLLGERTTEALQTLYGDRDPRLLEVNLQSVNRLIEQLDELSDITKNRIMSRDEFSSLVVAAVDSVDISLIPDIIDAVFVGTGEDSLFFDVKVMFVAGAAAGKMPRESGWQAVMSDTDVAVMSRRGLELYPTPVDKLKEEKIAVLDLLTKATEKVYISYAAYSALSGKQSAADFVKAAAEVLSRPIVKLSDTFGKDLDYAVDGLGNLENAYYELLRQEALGLSLNNAGFYKSLRRYLSTTEYGKRLDSISHDRHDVKLDDYLPVVGGDSTSVSKIECFMTCPYQFFMRYALRVKPRDEGEVRVMDVGIILHRVLELFFGETQNRLDVMNDAEVVDFCSQVIDRVFADAKFVPQNPTAGDRILLDGLRKEAAANVKRLVSYLKNGKLRPKWVELAFGKGARKFEIETAAGTISLSGKIDRVDEFNGLIAVYDYKTGNVDDMAKPVGLYYGLHIQLFAYLSILQRDGLRPIGAYYVPISNDFRSENKATRLLEGHTSALPSEYEALDCHLAEQPPRTDFLPIKFKSVKKVPTIDTSKNMLSHDEFEDCERYAIGIISNAVAAIADGYAERRPIGTCEYCEFASLCGTDVKTRKKDKVTFSDGKFYRTRTAVEDDGND